jgi:hypothetical protein
MSWATKILATIGLLWLLWIVVSAFTSVPGPIGLNP